MSINNLTNEELKSQLKAECAALNLSEYFNKTEKFIKNSILMALEQVDELPLGKSKIGGLPDLPKHEHWFANDDGQPMSFVAQINFAEVKAFDLDNKLPPTGILYLFYDQEQVWGYDPKDKNGKKVFFYEGSLTELETKPMPQGLDFIYDTAQISFSARASLPNIASNLIDLELSDEEFDILYDLQDNLLFGNKLLGHSDNIQNGMEWECELVNHGFYCGDSEAYQSEQGLALAKNAGQWNLLLQIDSNEDQCNMMWGDSGRIYLWIKDEDLKNKNFENSWLILQCC